MTLLLCLGPCLLAGCDEPGPASPANEQVATFVGRQACIECHEDQSELFVGSDHDLAMDPATPETVLGDFTGSSFTHAGVTSTFYQRDGGYFVRTDGADGELREFPIPYTFGVRPLQQYLVDIGDGRYQSLGVCWDARSIEAGGQRWFHVYGDEPIDHRDELHWTGALQNWNFMCAECHSTRLEKGYIAAEDRFETTWSEIDVSCEACHGPGSEHVNWARTIKAGDRRLAAGLRVPVDAFWIFDEGAPTARRAVPLESNDQVDACGRCHSRRSLVWPEYRHGEPLAETHRVSLLEENLYHADGQILDEVYVYGSFLQSKMYHNDVTCSDCHDPHTARLSAQGNALCARCHDTKVFDTPEHHHHEVGSSGAQCVECHMPSRNYMVVDPRRDHSFRVPRPDLTVDIGTPNACSTCHEDETAQWASDRVIEWYGADRSDMPHYGEAIDAARRGVPGAAAGLVRLIDDVEIPAIVRATAVTLLRAEPNEGTAAVVSRAARDESELVRRAAADMLDVLPPETAQSLGELLLADPMRTIRLEAAATVARLPGQSPRRSAAFESAVDEYRISQAFNADRAESHVNLGNLEASLGDAVAAEAAYRSGLVRDPAFTPAAVNLADLLRATGRDVQGEQVLRESLARAETAATHHALGLLLIRLRRHAEALEHLEAAASRQPANARYVYIFAVALHDLGDPERSVAVLEAGLEQHPNDRSFLMALATYCAELGRQQEARRWAERLGALPAN